MGGNLRDKIEYVALCVDKFAEHHGIARARACDYLYSHGGLHFLDEFYPEESALTDRVMIEGLVVPREGGSCMSDEAIRRQLRRSAIAQLIEQVMKEEGVSLSDAVKVVYSSRLYGLIEDEATGLYREGPVYLYDMLCEERRGNGATNLPPGRRIEMPRRSSYASG